MTTAGQRPTTTTDDPTLMPSSVSADVGLFDRFAGWSSQIVGRAAFFMFCTLLVVLWAPSILVLRDINTWQLIINTATTIITFLMVALLQNSHTRSDQAVQHKLNAIADGLASLVANQTGQADTDDLRQDITELRAAVGVENRESSAAGSVSDPGPSNC